MGGLGSTNVDVVFGAADMSEVPRGRQNAPRRAGKVGPGGRSGLDGRSRLRIYPPHGAVGLGGRREAHTPQSAIKIAKNEQNYYKRRLRTAVIISLAREFGPKCLRPALEHTTSHVSY